MGCTQSVSETAVPVEDDKITRVGVGQSERLYSSNLQRSKANVSTVFNPDTQTIEEDDEESSDHLDSTGKLLPEEFDARTTCCTHTLSVTVGDTDKGHETSTIQYAYRTMRGFYPDKLKKPNQDSYTICMTLSGDLDDDPMFAVYDGHGEYGHDCAEYARKKLPKSITKYMKQKRAQLHMSKLKEEGKSTKGAWDPSAWPSLDEKTFEECCRLAMHETNNSLNKDEKVNSKLSGTTAATVCFHAGRMTVCNVGDSRVLLGHREEKDGESKLIALPLTRDQTPYRKDERDRVRKAGADVMTYDQLKGVESKHDNFGDLVLGERIDIQGDPPRLWVPGKETPGTAFTRSLGDDVAEKIGVIAEPEMVTTSLCSHDEYLVIATDGIFEFLKNDQVLKICEESSNPVDACEKLTRAACDQWLEHDSRTDDITVIVCFLSSSYQPESGETGTTKDLHGNIHSIYGTGSNLSLEEAYK